MKSTVRQHLLSDPAKRRARRFAGRPSLIVFIIASLVAAAVLMPLVAIPQWLSQHARWDMLRASVGDIGKLAASMVDGDLHRKLLNPKDYSDELYARALEPLVRFHSANPNIYYLYTMVERNGATYFVLDTASSRELRTPRQLRASAYMERFDVREEYKDDWLRQIEMGDTYVTPTFEQDNYGYFLSAHAPIYDSRGRYSGFVGVDFDTDYYVSRETRFRAIAVGTLVAAALLALLIGYIVALYQSAVQHRLQQYRENAIRDSLTGFLNRRGTAEFIKPKLELHEGKCALILVDIDNLKMINDLRGHVTGDAVMAQAAEAVRKSLREGAECGRIGDELVVFAPDCDLDDAIDVARRILARSSAQELPLAGAPFTVSIGIATHEGTGAKFESVYRQADAALHKARAEGRHRIAVFGASTAGAFQSERINSQSNDLQNETSSE